MAGSSVIKITSVDQVGDVTRIAVKFPDEASVRKALVQSLLDNGCELTVYRGASSYNPEKAAAARATQKALVEAALQSMKTGRPATDFLSPELAAKISG